MSAADPMGVSGTATDVAPSSSAPAANAPRTRKPRKPDPEAPRRKALVTSIFAEATKAGDATGAAAISRLLSMTEGGEGKESTRFKSSDFKDESVGTKFYYDFRIAWHEQKIAELRKARDGKKPMSQDKAKKKLDKIGKDIEALKAQLMDQGIDPAQFGELGSLLGIKLG